MEKSPKHASPKPHKNEAITDVLASWGIRNTLTNHFKNLGNPCYKRFELNMLFDDYDRITHPLSTDIKRLLSETISFRNATDSDFQEIRDLYQEDSQRDKIFNEITQAIQKAKKICDNEKNPEAHAIMSDAIDYCMKSVSNRLNDLKVNHDKIYDYYLKKDNALKTLLK